MNFLDKLKENENNFMLQQEIGKLDDVLAFEFLEGLSLVEIVDLCYFLNHLVWEAFERGKNYDLLSSKVVMCYDYIRSRFSLHEFDTVDLIWFLISLATMTLNLIYQYEKAAEIMRSILTLDSKTRKQECAALEWLITSQVVSKDEKDMYEKRLTCLNQG